MNTMLKNATHLALVRLSAEPGAPPPDPLSLVSGLARAGVHEIAEAAHGDAPACAGLAVAALASARPGAVLWVSQGAALREHGRIAGRGLADFGVDPGRLLCARAEKPLAALWAVEEGLASGAVSAVVAELAEASFTATRRLVLATEKTGVPAILLLPHRRAGATAAATRWRVGPAPSVPDPWDAEAPGASRWRARIERARAAPAAAGRTHELEFDHETLSLRLVPGVADRPAEAEPPRRRPHPRPAAGGEWRRAG